MVITSPWYILNGNIHKDLDVSDRDLDLDENLFPGSNGHDLPGKRLPE